MGKLADALKQKYKTPHAALKALGLDGALLRKEVVGDSMPAALKGVPAKMNLMAYNYGLGLALGMDAPSRAMQQRVRIKGGMKEFVGKTGIIVSKEGSQYRVRLDNPVEIPGVGRVSDDLWDGNFLTKID